MSGSIDHTATDDVVCPYCGHLHEGAELESDDSSYECDACEKDFGYMRIVDVTYSTYELEHP